MDNMRTHMQKASIQTVEARIGTGIGTKDTITKDTITKETKDMKEDRGAQTDKHKEDIDQDQPTTEAEGKKHIY